MFEILKIFTTELFATPQRTLDDGTENPKYDRQLELWRFKLVSLISVLGLAVITHQLQAYGLILGEGFAPAEEVGEIQGTLIAREIDVVDTKLCMNPGDSTLLNYLDRLNGEYYEATGRDYVHKDCGILLRLRP